MNNRLTIIIGATIGALLALLTYSTTYGTPDYVIRMLSKWWI